MSAASLALQWVLGGGFAALGLLTLVEWLRHRDRMRMYLAISIGMLGAVSLLGSIQSVGVTLGGLLRELSLILFLGSGWTFLMFRHSLVRLSRPVLVTAAVVGCAVTVFLLVAYAPGASTGAPTRLQSVAALLLLALWSGWVVEPVVRVWRLSATRPAVQQARLRSLLSAYAAIVVVLILSVVAGLVAPIAPAVRVAATALTVLIIPLFYVAFAPPKWVKRVWRETEEQALRLALGDLLLYSPDRATLAERAVGWAARLLGADAAMIATDDNAVLATWGIDRDAGWEIAGGHGAANGDASRLMRGSHEMIQVPLQSQYCGGVVAVRSGPLTPLFGEEEVQRLRNYANALTTALDRVLLVERLRRQGELLDLTFNPIITWNVKSGKIVYWNRGAENLYGWSAEEAVGRTPDEVLHSVLPISRDEIVSDMLSHGEWEAEIQQRTKSGGELTVDARWALQLDDDGKPETVLEINRDVTSERRAAAELHRAREQAERASNAKSEYLSRMSHELRTPLTAILGYSDLLELRDPRDDQLEALSAIQEASSHLLSLVNDVLDIARIESGTEMATPESVSLPAVADECIRLVAPAASQRRVTLRCDLSDAPGAVVEGNRQRLVQVLLNLLSNAVKYSGEGASVTLRARPLDGNRVRLEVVDTGPGLTPDKRERLFEPFDRLGAERTTTPGTGLGLALSKKLVEAMGGVIGVDTEPGRGSTFWVELHRAAVSDLVPDDLPRKRAELGPPASTAEHTVLYVEDNLATITLMEEVFAMRPNIRMISAMQGSMALALAHEHCPDLVVLDLHLPDLGGDEILERLRRDPHTARIQVVMFSADATERQAARLLEMGAREYLVKPAKVADFLNMLDRVLLPVAVAAG